MKMATKQPKAKGHKKGPRGEKEVAKILMDWWRPAFPNAVFVRTPGSGGWGGQSRIHQYVKGGMRASGDLMTTCQEFPFSVEVKREQNWTHERMREGRPSPVWKWWIQAQTQANNDDLIPMLWFRHNREPWSVFIPFEYAKRFQLPPPLYVWSYRALRGIDHGPLLPVLYQGDLLVTADPRQFAEGGCNAEG